MEACKIEEKGNLLFIDSYVYWGNKKSLDGWAPKVGNFYVLGTHSGFKRYISHKPISPESMEQKHKEIAKLAREYGAEPAEIIPTHRKFYTFEKYRNIFFLGQSSGCQKDLDAIQRVLDEGKLDREILLSLEIKLFYKTDSSCIIDIKKPLKKVHTELLKSLDAILFSS